MRNRIIAGLFTTAVLIFAGPVAATEIDNISHSSRIEEIQKMIQRSRERQGVVQTTQEAESESTPAPESAEKPTSDTLRPIVAVEPQIKVVPESTTVFEPNKPKTVFQPNTVFAPVNPATTPAPAKVTIPATEPRTRAQSRGVPQRAQQVAVRHANRYRHQSASDEPPVTQKEPSREVQVSHKPFMLFAADLAWDRVDESSDKSIRNPYSLGARLENGVITPLAAIRVYAPDKLPEALAILAGEKEYT